MRHERKLSYQRVAQSDSTGTNLQVYGRYVRKLHRELESPGFLQDFFLLSLSQRVFPAAALIFRLSFHGRGVGCVSVRTAGGRGGA